MNWLIERETGTGWWLVRLNGSKARILASSYACALMLVPVWERQRALVPVIESWHLGADGEPDEHRIEVA